MKRILPYVFCLLLLSTAVTGQTVISMKIDGPINPVTANFIHHGIEKAKKENAACLLINLNTPGGLLKSTRLIVMDMLESPVPVIVYVSPGGAQSGSAGVFITLAANFAAMAPGTNIGAAHPVSSQGNMDSIMNEKITNDAAAFIRSIAKKRNRNMEWAENVVRKSTSYSETEALNDSAIDMIAINEQYLLNKVDGKNIDLAAGPVILHTRGARIESFNMGIPEKLLNILSDPTIAYILLLIGLYGIMFELYNPGAILPGIVGVISLVLAFYSMQSLPVNYAGLALIVFAIMLFLLEIKISSHGMLAIGGVVSLLLGSMMLIKPGSELELVNISLTVIITATVLSALFFLLIIGAGLQAQRRKAVTGLDSMIGEMAEVIAPDGAKGLVKVNGEIWNAESLRGVISKGEIVRIKEIRDLTLYVE